METMNDFISRRKTEILEEIGRLRAELRQIAAAEGVAVTEPRTGTALTSRSPVTIKEQVVAVLADFPKGLEAVEILNLLRSRYGRNLKRESLSPQLSRLGAEGVIRRDGKTWALPIVGNALDRLRQSVKAKNGHLEFATEPSSDDGLFAKENPQEVYS